MLANKQDVEGAMTAMEISQSLKLHGLKQQSWQIQACSAVTGAAAKAHMWHRVRMAPTSSHPARAARRAGPAASAPQALSPQCRSVASTAWRLKAPPHSPPPALQPLTRSHPHCLRHAGKGLHEGMDWVAHTLRTKR